MFLSNFHMLITFVTNTEDNGAAIVLMVSGSNPSDALTVIPVVAGFPIRKILPSTDKIGKLGHRLKGMFTRDAIQITKEDARITIVAKQNQTVSYWLEGAADPGVE